MDEEQTRQDPRITPQNILTRWKPGFCPNPGGRPKKLPVSEAYRKILEMQSADGQQVRLPPGATNAEVMAVGQFMAAFNGSANSAREMREAIEGRSPLRVELTNADQAELVVKIVDVTESL